MGSTTKVLQYGGVTLALVGAAVGLVLWFGRMESKSPTLAGRRHGSQGTAGALARGAARRG